MPADLPRPSFAGWAAPGLVAILAGTAVLATLDPAGSYPAAPQGPGLTVDERFNVQEGVRLAVGLPAVLAGEVGLTELFNDDNPPALREVIGNHLPDHPPLGRLWMGAFHGIARELAPPHDPAGPFVVACARTAPAVAFALTVFLVGWTAARWYGVAAGVIASTSLALMPRLFGHAHLASLETFIGLTYTASILSVAAWWVRVPGSRRIWGRRRSGATASGASGGLPASASVGSTVARADERPVAPPRPVARKPSVAAAAVAGIVFGLALLTKMQAVFLPVAVGLWAVARWRQRAIVPLAVWGGVGLVTLFAGWPWLWVDPLEHLAAYLGRAAQRAPLNVWYFGEQYADSAVPWHYPFVLFLVTVPVGFHVLAAFGWVRPGQKSPETAAREQLLLLGIAVPLVVFAWPGVAVYDGERLFLVVFPLWAVFVGRGGVAALEGLSKRRVRRGVAAGSLGAFVILQSVGLLSVHPASLSYYNLLAGGLPGARAVGLELSYWGDSLTRELLEAAALKLTQGSAIDVTPVLEPYQLDFLLDQSPVLRGRGLRLRAFEDRFLESGETRYLLYFHRHADINPLFHEGPPAGRLLAEVRRQGVQLAALYEFESGTTRRVVR